MDSILNNKLHQTWPRETKEKPNLQTFEFGMKIAADTKWKGKTEKNMWRKVGMLQSDLFFWQPTISGRPAH